MLSDPLIDYLKSDISQALEYFLIFPENLDALIFSELFGMQDRAELAWGQDLHCVALSNTGASAMHRLR